VSIYSEQKKKCGKCTLEVTNEVNLQSQRRSSPVSIAAILHTAWIASRCSYTHKDHMKLSFPAALRCSDRTRCSMTGGRQGFSDLQGAIGGLGSHKNKDCEGS
jgi:hypothetical protein